MTSKFLRPCVECGTLAYGTRCGVHEAQYRQQRERKKNTPERRERKRALYSYNYQQARKELLANATICHICKLPFTPTDRVEADHLIPGDPASPLAPAHRLCNQRRGNKPLN